MLVVLQHPLEPPYPPRQHNNRRRQRRTAHLQAHDHPRRRAGALKPPHAPICKRYAHAAVQAAAACVAPRPKSRASRPCWPRSPQPADPPIAPSSLGTGCDVNLRDGIVEGNATAAALQFTTVMVDCRFFYAGGCAECVVYVGAGGAGGQGGGRGCERHGCAADGDGRRGCSYGHGECGGGCAGCGGRGSGAWVLGLRLVLRWCGVVLREMWLRSDLRWTWH